MSAPVSREVLQRQATSSLDRAFQNLFSLVTEVIAVYKQREMVDGSASVDPRLEAVPPHMVEANMKAYKECFDNTGPEVHVDTVLELYSKVRGSLHRGYQCDSWLRNGDVSLYYGVSAREAGSKQVNLDCLFLMLESLKRADTQFRSQAAVLRIKFANQLYTIFMAALRYAQLVESEVNVRGVAPELTIESDLAVMEGLQTEILGDLPKPEKSAASGPAVGASPLAGLAQMFPGGLGDVVSSLLHTLPGITRTVTDTVARTTGTQISDTDQQMIDSTMRNITGMLQDPNGMRSMLSELGNGPDGISRFVERILTPAAAATIEAPPSGPAGPPLD